MAIDPRIPFPDIGPHLDSNTIVILPSQSLPSIRVTSGFIRTLTDLPRLLIKNVIVSRLKRGMSYLQSITSEYKFKWAKPCVLKSDI